jgi:hypothetical protein
VTERKQFDSSGNCGSAVECCTCTNAANRSTEWMPIADVPS